MGKVRVSNWFSVTLKFRRLLTYQSGGNDIWINWLRTWSLMLVEYTGIVCYFRKFTRLKFYTVSFLNRPLTSCRRSDCTNVCLYVYQPFWSHIGTCVVGGYVLKWEDVWTSKYFTKYNIGKRNFSSLKKYNMVRFSRKTAFAWHP